jgi:hypothetical protein
VLLLLATTAAAAAAAAAAAIAAVASVAAVDVLAAAVAAASACHLLFNEVPAVSHCSNRTEIFPMHMHVVALCVCANKRSIMIVFVECRAPKIAYQQSPLVHRSMRNSACSPIQARGPTCGSDSVAPTFFRLLSHR